MIQVFEAIRATVIAYPALCGLTVYLCASAVLVIRAAQAAQLEAEGLDDRPSVKTEIISDAAWGYSEDFGLWVRDSKTGVRVPCNVARGYRIGMIVKDAV